MLKCILIQKLQNKEFSQFLTDILATPSLSDHAQLFVQPHYNNLFAAKVDLIDFLKKKKSNVITDELDALIALANERDSNFYGIFKILQAYTNYPDSIMSEHAHSLLAPVASFGWEREPKNYRIEFIMITDLLHYWASDVERLIGIKALNLYDWQVHLAAMDTAFNTRSTNNPLQGASLTAYTTLKEKRLAASNAYHELYKYLKAHTIINEDKAPFDKVMNDLNVIINKFSQQINTRFTPEA